MTRLTRTGLDAATRPPVLFSRVDRMAPAMEINCSLRTRMARNIPVTRPTRTGLNVVTCSPVLLVHLDRVFPVKKKAWFEKTSVLVGMYCMVLIAGLCVCLSFPRMVLYIGVPCRN